MKFKFNLLTAAALIALPAMAGAQEPGQAEAQTPPAAEETVPEPQASEPQPTEESQPEASQAAQPPAQATPPSEATPPAQAAPPAEDSAADAVDQSQSQPPADAQANSSANGAAAGPVTPVTAADVRSGMAVVDTQGGEVGTIESVDADGAVVATGKVRAKLPLTSFGKNNLGLVISLTREQLEAAAQTQTQSQ